MARSVVCPMIRPTACCPFGTRQVVGCGYADESAPPQPKIQFHTIAAGGDGAMKSGQAREPDHGVDDLLTIGGGTGLNHLALLGGDCSICHATRGVPAAGKGGLLPVSSSI